MSSSADQARWQRVKSLLGQAIEMTPEGRCAFLDEACPEELRADVESLLRHVSSAVCLDEGLSSVALDETVNLVGTRLGAYRLERLVESGGMGSVYSAVRDDGEFRKRAAIKVIRRRAATDEALRRFRVERQVLADIDHPNIARLLDGGTTDDGLPYLVMDFIDGDPIDRYCDRRRLSVVERLGLFAQVCAAVQFAHDRQIVHRDIKPDNILITSEGEPKLLDFGLAKLLVPELMDQSVHLTATGRRLMTPAFASPEQVRGAPITVASDIYSLGMLLYLLVCGHLPYRIDEYGIEAVERAVCETPTPPPSRMVWNVDESRSGVGEARRITPETVGAGRDTDPKSLSRILENGVDAVVLQALAKDPSARHASAALLAAAAEEAGSIAASSASPARAAEGAGGVSETAKTTVPSPQRHRAPDAPRVPGSGIGAYWGHLQVVEKIGEGQYGEVYKCRDTALDHVVALKLFGSEETLEGAAGGAVSRILREGRLLARVQHPNVVRVYGIAVHEGGVGLWMEYIHGRTLAELLRAQGKMSDREAGMIGIDLCRALAAVHSHGVVHRDIKAQNVVREDGGRIILMDFGAGGDLPGLTGSAADAVGTPLYMAPEVLRGEPTSFRSDLYSLGVLLYHLVTERFPVAASSMAELARLHEQGGGNLLRDARPDLPAGFAGAIEKAMSPAPEDRYATAGEFQQALETALGAPKPVPVPPSPWGRVVERWRDAGPERWAYALGAAVVLTIAGYGIGQLGPPPPAPPPRPPNYAMPPPPGLKQGLGFGPAVAISPDGRNQVYVMERGRTTMLFVKELDSIEYRPLRNTEGARSPFFSPEGRRVGYFDEDDRKLKKISLDGGEPSVVADADTPWLGASWGSDDTIVFASRYSGLIRVAATGGTSEPVTRGAFREHLWPRHLPGGEFVLFTILHDGGSFDRADIAVVPVAGGPIEIVLESAYYPHYSPTGHLVFMQGDEVLAAPFDLQSRRVTGRSVTVLDGVGTSSWAGHADFAFSGEGTLVYISGGTDRSHATLVRVERDGTPSELVTRPRSYSTPRLSRQGQLASTILDDDVDIWMYDSRLNPIRVTESPSWDGYSLWHPGTDWISFSSTRLEGVPSLFRQNLLSGAIETLVASGHPTFPGSWTGDGRLLAYWEENPATGLDLWVYDLETRASTPFRITDYNESGPEFSPDGKFIAYESKESGEEVQVFVLPYPPSSSRPLQVSVDGGHSPRWNAEGSELFYLNGETMNVVGLDTTNGFVPSVPRELFSGPFGGHYDVAADGSWFVMIREMADDGPPMRVNVLHDWFERLEQVGATSR